ncbi:MAG: hypothetical protein ThorAB25_00190 [Candidatus Thorarchaeota archaeon AB_25]|nr:MAG: hypothetical protein ThorAB25_00190 [Candidatus Thorarchaeota archaeon AB_25]
MSSTDNPDQSTWVPTTPPNIPRSSMINLVNLLLRESAHRITVLERARGPDPELYVVTRVDWRSTDSERPMLPQLPKLLSLLETLRGTKGVPREVKLDSTEGVAVYLPTGIKVSGLPKDPKKSVQELMSIIEDSLSHLLSTMREVEKWFWKAARKNGFSPPIVERMARKETGFSSPDLMMRFQRMLHKYFSLKFRIYRAEARLRVEAD